MKPLPIKGASSLYLAKKEEDCTKEELSLGKVVKTNDCATILNVLQKINTLPRFKYVIIDTITHMITGKFMKDIAVRGFDKYTNLANEVYLVIQQMLAMRDDMIIFLMAHTEYFTDDKGSVTWKMKTIGKLLDEKIVPESYFSIVLEATATQTEDKQAIYQFITNDPNTPAKSPLGMFEDKYIPNDLLLVTDRIKEYEQL